MPAVPLAPRIDEEEIRTLFLVALLGAILGARRAPRLVPA
jgi:hypothetical protein